MSWFFWVVVFAWVVPIILRKMSQGQRGRQIPPRDRGYNRYGGYPGNPYPRGVPGTQPPAEQGQQPSGPVPPPPAPPGENWWQQPIPPGTFPGQEIPSAPSPDQGSGAPSPVPPPAPTPPEPQGYRARRLAELDQQFTDQKISLEEYMKARNDIMRG